MNCFGPRFSNTEARVTGAWAAVRSRWWQRCVVGGFPHVAAGRYADELTRAGECWRYRVEQVRFSYWTPLTEGRDRHRFTLESARNAAIPWGRAA